MTIANYIDKVEDFTALTAKEQIKLIAYFYTEVNSVDTFTTSDILKCFKDERLKIPTKNMSQSFKYLQEGKSPVIIALGKYSYSLHRNIKNELDGIYKITPHKKVVALLLIDNIRKVKGIEQQSFLHEAIKCYEIQCFRAAIIMSWLLTMDVLYENVLNTNLAAFNTAMQTHTKYKKFNQISKKEDFSDIKELDFIELLRGAGIISNNIRKILVKRLDERNTNAHPNTIKITEANANHFIEDLLINVVEKFQI